MAMHFKRFLGIFVVCFLTFSESTVPSGCSYDSTDSVGIYTCDFSQLGFPLVYYGFSPAPQRLKLKNINGNLPGSGTFSGFSSYSSASFDTNYASSLELECITSAAASLTITGTTFSGMGYVQQLKIKNCYTSSFPTSVFSNIIEVDSLIITGGTAAGLASDSFTGLSIKNLSVPNSQSLFEMSNTVLPGGTLPANLLSGFTDVKQIVLDNVGLTSISASDLSSNTMLTYLSLKHNSFTTIPSDLFTGLDGLNLLDVTGIDWDCSCDNLWFLEYAITNGIEITEGVICNTPTSYLVKPSKNGVSDACQFS
ncbi:hypothetical protein KUTeg_002051 [Tegillarca granosa]|uniref:Uncharacterized protein n=1 Tax=Tegillarca granosa TaxID=220873 RepID=A0ABQ9FT72_TEGGR|nr:hypothetical protein KUTeg_002051 [Tegillarca granosa]